MLEHLPADVIVFALSVIAFVAIGLPLITRYVFLPAHVEFERVADHELTAEQSSFVGRHDAELLELGYRPVGIWRPTNMQGRALLRLYTNAADPAVVTLNMLTSQVPVADEQSATYLEIVTRYRDGSILSTRNAEVSDVLELLPDHVLVERRGLRDSARLKQAHDAKASELLARDPVHLQPETFESVFNEHHERWCAHLLTRGLLRRDRDDPGKLHPTIRTGVRGVINFINPLADNFTVVRFLIGVALGLLAPAAVLVWLGGPGLASVSTLAATLGLEQQSVLTIALVVTLGLSGAAVGLVFVEKSFIWSFAFTYTLLHLVSPTGFVVTLLLCLWSGAVADQTARRRLRRRIQA